MQLYDEYFLFLIVKVRAVYSIVFCDIVWQCSPAVCSLVLHYTEQTCM